MFSTLCHGLHLPVLVFAPSTRVCRHGVGPFDVQMHCCSLARSYLDQHLTNLCTGVQVVPAKLCIYVVKCCLVHDWCNLSCLLHALKIVTPHHACDSQTWNALVFGRNSELQPPASFTQTHASNAKLCFFVGIPSFMVLYGFSRLSELPSATVTKTTYGSYSQVRTLLNGSLIDSGSISPTKEGCSNTFLDQRPRENIVTKYSNSLAGPSN